MVDFMTGLGENVFKVLGLQRRRRSIVCPTTTCPELGHPWPLPEAYTVEITKYYATIWDRSKINTKEVGFFEGADDNLVS